MRKGILALIAYSISNSVLFFMFGYTLGGKVKTDFYDTLIRNMLPNGAILKMNRLIILLRILKMKRIFIS